MRVIVGCEFSGIVTKAFRDRGHDAYSCDLLPSEGNPAWHYQMDLLELLDREEFDLGIFHPPCTYLAVSGARWWKDRWKEQQYAIAFVAMIARQDCPKIAIENPVGILSTVWRKPDQYIQPWQFGHGETKKTGLWLKGLPLLQPTNVVEGREPRIHHMAPSENRSKERSRTYPGIAQGMAEQWGKE